ncbi:MAG: response regulator [bacterium]|nr:response regulator [bacterium]
MAQIELDKEFIELFYGITNTPPPVEVNILNLKKQLINIVDTLKELNNNSKKPIFNKYLNDNTPKEEVKDNAILIVDDLGVITYQLKMLLNQFDYDIDCSQEIYDAIAKVKQRKYQYIIMDLFIPTEREGFILLTELKKMINKSGSKAIIGVITASPRKEIEQQCKARGADFFLEKSNDWQHELYKIMDGYINGEKDPDDIY